MGSGTDVGVYQGTKAVSSRGGHKGLEVHFANIEGVADSTTARLVIPTIGTMSSGTLYCEFTPDSSHSTTHGAVFSHGDYANNHRLYIGVYGGQFMIRLGSGGYGAVGTLAIGQPNRIAVTWSGGSSVIYVNGERYTYSYSGTPGSAVASTCFGCVQNGGIYLPYVGSVKELGVVREEVAESRLFEYSANRWQMFESLNEERFPDTSGPLGGSINPSEETDEAQSITSHKEKAVTHSSETDEAQSLGVEKHITVGTVTETDEAQSLLVEKHRSVSPAEETDSSVAIVLGGSTPVSPAEETDTAVSIGKQKSLSVGTVTETDEAQSISVGKGYSVSPATETDESQSIGYYKHNLIGVATEADSALEITVTGGSQPVTENAGALGGGAKFDPEDNAERRRIIEEALGLREVYESVIETDDKQAAAEIVKDFTTSKKKIPEPESIDFESLVLRIDLVERLIQIEEEGIMLLMLMAA
jgi:hypothetical protein